MRMLLMRRYCTAPPPLVMRMLLMRRYCTAPPPLVTVDCHHRVVWQVFFEILQRYSRVMHEYRYDKDETGTRVCKYSLLRMSIRYQIRFYGFDMGVPHRQTRFYDLFL